MQLPAWLTATRLGIILMVAGGLLSGISLLADILSIGIHPQSFGYRQFAGTAIGLLTVVVGMAIYLIDKEPKSE